MAERESTKVLAVRLPESMVMVLKKEARRRRVIMSDYLRRVLGAEVELLESRTVQSVGSSGLGVKADADGSSSTSVEDSIESQAAPVSDEANGDGSLPSGYLAPDGLPSSVQSFPKVGRNAMCPCGSGRKYKVCHERLS